MNIQANEEVDLKLQIAQDNKTISTIRLKKNVSYIFKIQVQFL